ncbi:MAG: hypothetical protein HY513_03365 [Candidatus Aenigmarchaeota archaeon]|nr:hypothetical protein [Candidatus Aenigmarchaeota archaeon]
MLRKSVTKKLKAKIRKEYENGKGRLNLANKYNVSFMTVFKLTVNITSRTARRLTPQQREQIKQMAMAGVQKSEIMRKMDVSPMVVYNLTKNLPCTKRFRRLYIHDIKLLQNMLKDGYYVSNGKDVNGWRTLCRYFPVKKVSYNHRIVYFLDDRRELALKGFVSCLGSVLTYTNFTELARLFGVPLDAKMRAELGHEKAEKGGLKKPDRTGLDRRITDFIGSFLLSEVLGHLLKL